ncbi:MAG: EAL domain-containing protein [Candidatus Competibacteraceae bacterium]|nr:EAL domain-containing protein [Candidatus Competibacteraceae bacterium]
MASKTSFPEPLAGKLRRIEDLAEKLVYIKWSREFFVLLQRSAQDILNLASPRPEYHKIAVLAERLQQQIGECLEKGELPRGSERERLIAVADALCRATPNAEDDGRDPVAPESRRSITTLTIPLFSKWDQGERTPPNPGEKTAKSFPLWLVAPETAQILGRKLEQRGGFEVLMRASLNEVRLALAQSQQPAALIIDLDHVSDSQTTLQQIGSLRQLLAPEIPLFFLADRGDITARLDAVEAGAAGYFIKPVDIPLLLEALDERVLKTQDHRILLVEDSLPAAREAARWLESRGMATQVLAQPLQILQALYNFQPSLLILSLDLKETDGLTLARAIQQHELFRELPLILLSAQTDIGQRLSAAGLGGEALLGKPLNPELLFAALAKRLRQGHGLYRKLSQISNRDTVSDLYNRPYFLAHLERVLVATAANAQPVAIMLIALDNLRGIENSDVAAADEVVEQAAKRLKATLGADPIAARFGDAVFTVLLSFANQDALLATARALQESLEAQPYALASGDFKLRASIGISIASPTVNEASMLIQQADLACGMARDSKDTRIYVHRGQSGEQDTDAIGQRRLLEEIREAVQQQRMNLLFQPVVSLRGDTTERYEVLLRMRNLEGWELLPETVFGLVKRHRIGMVLDRWVIAHSIRVLRERQIRGHSVILFINISPTILQDEELLNWLRSGLQKTGVPAAKLVFEMTETTAELNRQALLPFLRQIKDLGCGISLDHFSGHERAQALVQLLQVDYVKLDPRFTQNLLNEKDRQQQLSETVHTLATLGVTTIVTGVEDAAILPALWACGIDYVQGFLLQRPHTDMSYDFAHMVL